jgi:16S rRNA (guanine1207-N2)-methyltransferase
MPDHYYSRNPGVESKPIFWEYTLREHAFHFKTDQGVFSKKEVDFGSRLLAESVEKPEIEGPILDVGCGYGAIGLSLAKSFPERLVHMIDVNHRALELASENAKANSVGNVKIYESDRLHAVADEDFALIVTNPPIRAGKQIVHDILFQSFQHLAPKGELWVVIQKKQGAPSAKARMEELFEDVDVVTKDKGYFILRGKKH